MDKVINFLNEYGLLSAIITGLASALGVLREERLLRGREHACVDRLRAARVLR